MGTKDLQWEKPVRVEVMSKSRGSQGVAVGFAGKVSLMQSVQGGELGHEP